MVMLFKGFGVVPCVFSMLNVILYPTATHFGYSVAFSLDAKHPSIMPGVIESGPGLMSIPLPSGEVLHTVA